MIGFRVTYEIVTHESAEHGDAAERGFMSPGEWRTDDAPGPMSLRDAIRMSWGASEDCGRWFSSSPEQDFRTGAYETRALHPPANITDASYARLKRLLARHV